MISFGPSVKSPIAMGYVTNTYTKEKYKNIFRNKEEKSFGECL